ncbi:ETC complex I subunit conserved region-domain-containing protein [Daldinia caldariorum]|uniref:ETC complex I subunit conserved region-domain-containing protein n=1 Tax=Daldinia caldariorum TaxID=326644 RepID=UPI00200749EE|nr:ETC complex I subunit conserved region-domain-containing protein [Daldinia caldariorum]KAI1465898.1 ETC complex I subunit conserved region-domain-containing protein [Daldinia caldariorum]
MRRTLRLFAAVKPTTTTARYLEPGAPTGLTGLLTHGSPRSTLLYLYTRTLEKLQDFPESSLYRQSVEALTKHRLSVVEAAQPPGYEEWAARARQIAEQNPARFRVSTVGSGSPAEGSLALQVASGGKLFVHRSAPPPQDERYLEWDGERDEGPGSEGLRGEEERRAHEALFNKEPTDGPDTKVQWEPEPQLTADQIEEIESKIGGGLIEEVVRVAENELRLVDIMKEHKVWEELEEKPAEGQWTYFERNAQ